VENFTGNVYQRFSTVTKWINLLSKTAHFPEEWKTAIIDPIFKNKGSAQEIANYRPIALTSCMRRVYERCVLKEMANLFPDCTVFMKFILYFVKRRQLFYQLISSKPISSQKTFTPVKLFLRVTSTGLTTPSVE
jgi:hypothetical protein